MSAGTSRNYAHNALWRKMRRRYVFSPWLIGMYLLGLLPRLCLIAWLWREAGFGGLVSLLAALWTLRNGATLLFECFIAFAISRAKQGEAWPLIRSQALSFLTTLLEFGALVSGHVEVAILLSLGMRLATALLSRQPLQGRIEAILRNAALLVASVYPAPWFALLLILHEQWRAVAETRVRPDLLAYIEELPARREYVQKTREQCAAGGG